MKSYWPFDIKQNDQQCRLYLLSGAEELLLNESYQQIVSLAKQNGFIEHHRFYGAEELDVTKLHQLIINKGLFSDGTLIDIRLPEAKTGRSGATVLTQTIDTISKNPHVFLILSANNTKGKLTAKWVEKYESMGNHIQHPILNNQRKQQWLQQRLQRANISIEPKGQEFLLVLTEGNFLALEQQIKQLELSPHTETFTLAQLRQRFQDEARFNLFELPEKIFSSQATKALRICRKLRQEGEPLVLIVWSIINELMLAFQLAEIKQNNQSPSAFLKQNRIWQEREKMLNNLANKGLVALQKHVQTLQHIDKQSKGQAVGDGWLKLEQFISENSSHQ